MIYQKEKSLKCISKDIAYDENQRYAIINDDDRASGTIQYGIIGIFLMEQLFHGDSFLFQSYKKLKSHKLRFHDMIILWIRKGQLYERIRLDICFYHLEITKTP